MVEKRIISVVGATGAQGGGLVRAILKQPGDGFRVRALTRKPKSEKAVELASLGAEVVEADLDDPDSLKQAFQGGYGAFCVTNFWEYLSPETEIAQAANMAKAARDVGLTHVIWSTLEDTRKWVPLDDNRMPTLMKKYKVPHLDAKGEADHLFTDYGVPTTFLLTSFLLGELDLLWHGPQARCGRYAGDRAADARQEAARHRRRGHRQVCLRPI